MENSDKLNYLWNNNNLHLNKFPLIPTLIQDVLYGYTSYWDIIINNFWRGVSPQGIFKKIKNIITNDLNIHAKKLSINKVNKLLNERSGLIKLMLILSPILFNLFYDYIKQDNNELFNQIDSLGKLQIYLFEYLDNNSNNFKQQNQTLTENTLSLIDTIRDIPVFSNYNTYIKWYKKKNRYYLQFLDYILTESIDNIDEIVDEVCLNFSFILDMCFCYVNNDNQHIINLYRGMKLYDYNVRNLKIGNTILGLKRGYTSTSIVYSTAENFSIEDEEVIKNKCCIFNIKLNDNTPYINYNDNVLVLEDNYGNIMNIYLESMYEDEAEVLLPRNITLKISDIQVIDNAVGLYNSTCLPQQTKIIELYEQLHNKFKEFITINNNEEKLSIYSNTILLNLEKHLNISFNKSVKQFKNEIKTKIKQLVSLLTDKNILDIFKINYDTKKIIDLLFNNLTSNEIEKNEFIFPIDTTSTNLLYVNICILYLYILINRTNCYSKTKTVLVCESNYNNVYKFTKIKKKYNDMNNICTVVKYNRSINYHSYKNICNEEIKTNRVIYYNKSLFEDIDNSNKLYNWHDNQNNDISSIKTQIN